MQKNAHTLLMLRVCGCEPTFEPPDNRFFTELAYPEVCRLTDPSPDFLLMNLLSKQDSLYLTKSQSTRSARNHDKMQF